MNKILVIDDEASLRKMILMALQQHNYQLLEAGDGQTGLELALKELPDLVICDVNMSPLNGYATLRELRNNPATSTMPVILMTGAADPAGMRQGMELGADDYLPKPFTIDALYAAVAARLKKAQTMRAEAEKKLAALRDNISLMLPHELRTPLNGILAYGEILQSDAASLKPEEIAEMGQVITESGRRLEHLVESFLIYSQIEVFASDPQKVAALRTARVQNPAELIAIHARQQAKRLSREQDISCDRLANVQVAIADNYLTKIVDELVNNALKYSRPGNLVTVTATTGAGKYILVVTDHGRGLDTEHIRKVGAYMQFERKLHEQQGLGLGLTICQRLAELYGGTLTIKSEKDNGTTVTVALPLAEEHHLQQLTLGKFGEASSPKLSPADIPAQS